MGVSRVISYSLVVGWALLVVSEDPPDSKGIISTGPTKVLTEGGSIIVPNDTTHMGREHMIKVNHSDEHMIKVNHTKETTTLPPYEVGQKNDNKTSVPKKDATLSDSANLTITNITMIRSNTTTTTTTPIPHKPTVTTGEDEEPPGSDDKTKTNDTQNHGISIESVAEKGKKFDYVVPIVAVILSVPIVAIVISVLYKRGSDWWQHRHYRRMDFLIDGMYNN